MRYPRNRSIPLTGLLSILAGSSTGSAPAGAAQGYCVTCSGPPATYICEIEGLSAQAAAGMQGQVLCIKQLATDGRHRQCMIDRNSATNCQGLLKVVSPATDEGKAPVLPAEPQPPKSAQHPAQLPADKTTKSSGDAYNPPATPAEPPPPAVASEPGQGKPDTRSVLQKTGDSIGEAVSKSWSCVASLFSAC